MEDRKKRLPYSILHSRSSTHPASCLRGKRPKRILAHISHMRTTWLEILERLARHFDGLLFGGEKPRIAKAELAVETLI